MKTTIDASRQIRASVEQVWTAISTPGYLERCHPFCERNPVQRWPGNDAVDTIHYYGGRVLERRFTSWLEGVGYDLVVVDTSRKKQAGVRWRIERESDSGCRLTVSLRILFLDRRSAPARWATYRFVVRPRMSRYLEAVVAGVAHYAETGEPVTRNQFGPHPWFSPAVGVADRSG